MAEEKAEKAESGATAKSGKSNLILIVIIAVLGTILVGGGITAFFLLKKDNGHAAEAVAEDTAATEAAPKSDSKKKDKSKDKKEGPKSPAIYVGLEPPFVVNFDATQASRFLQVTVEIMTRDSGMATMIKENDPAVRNDLLLLFGAQDATAIGTREGKEALRKETLEAVRTLIKAEGGNPDLVEAVYFTTFVMQ